MHLKVQVIFEVDPLSRLGLLPASFPCTLCHHLATSRPGQIDNLAKVDTPGSYPEN